ncbi:MAG: TatD family hydrolase [Bacteroidaceae bacterium]|nr:TatD family hydrolase [Bacteroidaceae bacterium]
MIDTHSHIYEPEFDADREDVVLRARQAGVEKILLPNINAASIGPMLDLCRRHPNYCYPMLGLHPEDVAPAAYRQVLADMEKLLEEPHHPYIAVGEVGLDFYWDQTTVREQEDAFRIQIGWAVRHRLPLVIHSRSAHRQLVAAMREYCHEELTGIFHCFGGTVEEAQELLQFSGFVLGIGGVLTYKKSTLPEVLATVPLERIVLETDAPYLAPVPHRGKRNESAFVVEVLRKVAHIYNVSEEHVEAVTNSNVKRTFPRLKLQ